LRTPALGDKHHAELFLL